MHPASPVCGIAGLIDGSGLARGWEADVRSLDRSLRHRGPDDHGWLTDRHGTEAPDQLTAARPVESPRIAFVHRRLSIIDLSVAARQPLARAGGRVFITYNGEVYNYRELRAELEQRGAVFRTQSDTEVVLEAYRCWGIEAVTRLRGIFAFAIADLERGVVYLARDHLGVKPLYVARTGTRHVFASELKAIADLPGFAREADAEALRSYLHFLWIPGERTGLRGVAKLPPGSWLEIDLATGAERRHTYWTPIGRAAETERETGAAVEHVRAEVSRAVAEQLVSDVPLGAFLSGGLDSSLIAALAQRTSGRGLATYSVGYSAADLAYDIVPDDLPFARAVSRELGTRSTEIELSPDVASLLPAIVETLDEPIGDPAAISSYLICQAAKRDLTVMLSGMGADEIFGGYPRQRAMLYGSLYRKAPGFARAGMAALLDRLPGAGAGRLAKLGRAGKKFLGSVEAGPFAHYVAMETYFSQALQERVLAADGALAAAEPPREALGDEIAASTDAPLKQAIVWDLLTYLPSLNLAYTDRTSMAHGIEVRVPFLDVRLVEWALSLPAHQLIHLRRGRLEGKWLLKQSARALLPDAIIWRKKAGFGAPVRSWLRNDLRDMREELLGPRGLGRRGWFDPAAIAALQEDFLSGRADFSLHLWMLLSLELWARRFLDRSRA